MTYLKSALFGSAIALAASSAAFAGGKKVMTDTSADAATWTQSPMQTGEYQDDGITTQTMAEKAMKKEMMMQDASMTDGTETVGEILQFDGEPQPTGDNDIVTYDGNLITEDAALSLEADNTLKNNAIVVPSSSGAITTVACPAGSVAMPDLTCHIKDEAAFTKAEFTLTTSKEAPSAVAGAIDYSGKTTTFDNQYNTQYNPNKEYLGTLRPGSVVQSRAVNSQDAGTVEYNTDVTTTFEHSPNPHKSKVKVTSGVDSSADTTTQSNSDALERSFNPQKSYKNFAR